MSDSSKILAAASSRRPLRGLLALTLASVAAGSAHLAMAAGRGAERVLEVPPGTLVPAKRPAG